MTVGMDQTAGQDDPPVPAPAPNPVKKSWVAAAKQNKVLKKYDLGDSVSEGDQSAVEVPAAVIDEANLLWKDFVIARFLEKAPHVAKVHVILNKIWTFGDKLQKVDVYEMDEVTMRIRIPDQAIREKIVRRGMWNIAGIPMVVSEWSPVEDESEAKLTPLWVHLTKVPMNMYSWEGLSFIASAAGIPDKLHPETIACTNFAVAKVCVKADLSKKLPSKMTFKIQGVDTMVEFAYPWLPSKCSFCEKWGHSEKVCSLNKMRKDENKEIQMQKKEVQGEGSEKLEVEESSKMEEIVSDNMEEKEVNNEPWKKVSPEKASRSPKPVLQFGQVKIATPSRFAALSISDEETDEVNEEQEEKQVEDGETNQKEVVGKKEEEVGKKEIGKEDQMNEDGKLKKKEVEGGRQILPRDSKTRHRVLSATSNQTRSDSGNMVRSTQRNH